MHDWLFANQNAWASAGDAAAQFRTQALALGADGATYDACVSDAKTQAAIQKDLKDGSTAGVRGTPAFFIAKNTAGEKATPKVISGALPYDQFAQAIEQVMAGQ